MIEIIPAIDIIDGKCVRLTQGDYGARRVYDQSPRDMVKRMVDSGLTRIHAVDLDGARRGRPVSLRVLEGMAAVNDAHIEWGGGLKTDDDVRDSLNAGAAYCVIGSTAARQPELMDSWLGRYGSDTMILGADVRDGRIAVSGWLDTADMGIRDIIDRYMPVGLTQAIVTEISRDGMLQGPDYALYEALLREYPSLTVTVSGGISGMADIQRLDEAGQRRVIVGRALYEGRVTLRQMQAYSGR